MALEEWMLRKNSKNKGGVTLESTIDDTNIVMPEWDLITLQV